MRIEQIKQTVTTVGDIETVQTDRLVIEGPDPEPSVTVNIEVKPVLNVVEHTDAASFKTSQSQLRRNFGTPSPVQTARTALEGKDPFHNPKPGDRQCTPTTGERAFDPPEDVGPPVHFDCHKPGENLAAFKEVHPEFNNEAHFNATPEYACGGCIKDQLHYGSGPKDIPLGYAAMEPRRPIREVPLWAFARDFISHEFGLVPKHRVEELADRFMEQYRMKWRDGKESGR